MTDLRKLASLCRARFREHRVDLRDPLAVSAAVWRVIAEQFPTAAEAERVDIEKRVMRELKGAAA